MLKRASEFREDSDFDDYIVASKLLTESGTLEDFRVMVECLSDCEAGEIQYELICGMEAFSDEVYLEGMFRFAHIGYERSPHWFDLAFCTLLNTENLTTRILSIAQKSEFCKRKISELVSGNEVDEKFCDAWRQHSRKIIEDKQ